MIHDFSNSVYNAASVNSTHLADQETPDDEILHTMEEFLLSHHVGESNEQEWKRVRNEAVEHLRNDVARKDYQNWNTVLKSKDARSLWTTINWKGSFTSADAGNKPELEDLATHFAA